MQHQRNSNQSQLVNPTQVHEHADRTPCRWFDLNVMKYRISLTIMPSQQFAPGVVGVGTGPAHRPAVADVLGGAVRPPEWDERGGHVVRVHLQLHLAPRTASRVL